MIHRDHFGHDRDVLSRIERDTNLGQLDVENRRDLRVEPGAVDVGVLIPLLELDDDLDAFLPAHGADAENRRNIHQTDAANLHVMPLKLVTAANENVGPATSRNDEIISNEPVAALDEIQDAFRFADATFADEQQ